MAETTATDVQASLLAANAAFMAAFSRGDAAACAACYTAQGQVLPPNNDILTGPQAIHTFWQGAMHMGITVVKLDTVEVEGHDHTAYEVGQYTLQGAGGQMFDTGKYMVIWHQEAGQWKIHRDIWNSSQPASGQ
jgi:ketosteroid isomerase-like protein